MEYQSIPMDIYIELLEQRREKVERQFGWTIADEYWDKAMDIIKEIGVVEKNADPMNIVDNLIVNGDYGDFDDYKEDGETDEEFIAREEGNCFAIYPEERIIIYSLG